MKGANVGEGQGRVNIRGAPDHLNVGHAIKFDGARFAHARTTR